MRRSASFLTVACLCAVQDIYGVRPDIEDVDTKSTTTTTTNIDSKIAWLVAFAGEHTVIKAIVDHIFGGKLRLVDTRESARKFAGKEAADGEAFNNETVGLVLESELKSTSTRARLKPTMANMDEILKTKNCSAPYLVEEGGGWSWKGGDAWRKTQRWRYMRNVSDKLEPYGLGHQKNDTCRLCQSFAQLYMFNDRWPDKKFGKPATTPRKLWNQLKKGEFGDNIKVIVEYWKAVFTQSKWKMGKETQEAEQEEQAEEEEEAEKNRKNTEDLSKGMLQGLRDVRWVFDDYDKLVNSSNAINFTLIVETLNYIHKNADSIAVEAD